MAYTDRFQDPFMRKRDDRKDLLKDAEDAFYGGGQGQRPTPTPTPTPRPTQLVMNGQPSGVLSKPTNAAGRVRPTRNLPTRESMLPLPVVSGSRYLGPNGTDLGPQYDDTGAVNPLPKGSVGIQGSQNAAAFNRSLNGAQPTPGSSPAPQMTHTQMAEDIAKRNLTASGSLLGTPQQQIPSGFQGYVSPEDAAAKGLQWTGGSTGWQPYVSPEQATQRGLQFTGGLNNVPSQQDQPTVHFLPPGFTATTGSTGAPGSTPNDVHFMPPGFTSVQGTVGENKQLQFQPQKESDEGYGSAYGY